MIEKDQDSLVNDHLNLLILDKICQGEGISFNISQLSNKLSRHRSTIKKRIDNLLKYKVIGKPDCPFTYLYQEYPLFVVVFADFPSYKEVEDWIKTDEQIFAAYSIREEEYNIMIIEFHKSLTLYQQWREELITKGKIPSRANRRASTSLFFSNDLQIKYEPETAIKVLDLLYKQKKTIEINKYRMDKLDLEILKCLLYGDGIKINENFLSKQLNSHRKTIENRIKKLIDNQIIQRPRCQFPQFFLPSNLLLVFSLIDLSDFNNKVFDQLKKDIHIPILFKVSIGKYNLLLFSVHESIDTFLSWNIDYREKFPNTFGIEKINYLSPRMTTFVNLQKVAMGVIKRKLKELSE
ncbi:MAG: Lrp/AsnC family transcriptional regulator [Candidatus Helarchaeota archaeon]|nr:Lrp/AsnC family transcriptional regulator [Candidatus Helarchaeota archaeon]